MRNIEESTALVTGATAGLGRRLALELAERGATVLLHGRDAGRADSAVEEVRERSANRRVYRYLADLSSLSEVRRLADRVRSDNDRLDLLINNAGIISQERHETATGVELTFAVNYLSHFLLTRELLPLLEPGARIVNVASVGQSPIDFDDPMLDHGYDPMRAYSQSKLAQILFTFELASRTQDHEITVNCLHPASLMDTRMVHEAFGHTMSTVDEGAAATLRLALSPELEGVTGRYFNGQREARANPQAYDQQSRERLWTLSERLCEVPAS